MHQKTDLRVKRTHILLREALIDLIAEKGFDAVTVGDIAERAMVNRATFYRHYEDKYALVTSIFENTAEEVMNELGPLEQRLDTINWIVNELDLPSEQPMSLEVEHAITAFSTLFEHFAKHAKLYKTMLGKQGSSWFTAQLRDYVAGNLYQRYQSSHQFEVKKGGLKDPMPDEFASICLANWFVGMITWWLEDGIDISSRQIAVWCLRFIIYGMYPYIESLNIKQKMT